MISAVAEMYGIHPQTLRLYEREGLLKPSRTEGNTRLYTEEDLQRLEFILSLARDLGATHVISVYLPAPPCLQAPTDVFQVVRRCFQIMQGRSEQGWRKSTDLVITPELLAIEWDGFESGPELVKAGEAAALAALPTIQSWLKSPFPKPSRLIPPATALG